ncbi:Gametolysin peptidase M11-domain-containing protein [Haematococcus lacustris]
MQPKQRPWPSCLLLLATSTLLAIATLPATLSQDCSQVNTDVTVEGTFLAMHFARDPRRQRRSLQQIADEDTDGNEYKLRDAAGKLKNLVFTTPDLVSPEDLTSGLIIRVWIDTAVQDAAPPSRSQSTVYALCFEVIDIDSQPKDYKPVNGQPYPFSSITFLVSSCGSGTTVDVPTLTAAYFNPNPVMTKGPLSGAGQTLTSFFTNCSFGGVTFLPANNIIVPVEVPCSGNTASGAVLRPAASFCEMVDQFAWMEYAESVAVARFGSAALTRFTNRIFILPARSCGGSAYATQGCNPNWCFATMTGPLDWGAFGGLVHEVGHTMGLAHAASPTDQYGDGSCPMGNAWAGPRCFVAPHQWQLGWSSPLQDITSANLAPGNWLTLQLPGLTLQQASFVRVFPTWNAGATTPTYFISFRPALGHDSGLAANGYGMANMVHIHTYNWSAVPAAIEWRPMWLRTLATPGAIWSDNWLSSLRVRLNSLAPDFTSASVGICRYTSSAETGAACFDGIDNDCNGLTDSQDPNCQTGALPITATCNNNRICEPQLGETPLTCLNDCPTSCGDGFCAPSLNKTARSCPADCPALCGDFICDALRGENRASCPTDCPTCGDGVCAAVVESSVSCALDCCPRSSVQCGDGVCDAWGGETCNSCPQDCASSSSPPYIGSAYFCCGISPRAGACDARCVRSGWRCNAFCPVQASSATLIIPPAHFTTTTTAPITTPTAPHTITPTTCQTQQSPAQSFHPPPL